MAIAGGNWNNGANAGVFYVNLNNLRSNANGNIGFRSASASNATRQKLYPQGDTPSTGGKRIAFPWPLPKNPVDAECREYPG